MSSSKAHSLCLASVHWGCCATHQHQDYKKGCRAPTCLQENVDQINPAGAMFSLDNQWTLQVPETDSVLYSPVPDVNCVPLFHVVCCCLFDSPWILIAYFWGVLGPKTRSLCTEMQNQHASHITAPRICLIFALIPALVWVAAAFVLVLESAVVLGFELINQKGSRLFMIGIDYCCSFLYRDWLSFNKRSLQDKQSVPLFGMIPAMTHVPVFCD